MGEDDEGHGSPPKTTRQGQELPCQLLWQPDTTHPLYQATHDTAEQLRGILFWLHEQKPKVYQRARWYLFYDLAARAIRQADDLAQEKVRAIYAEQRAEDWRCHQIAQTMSGDGYGI